MTLLRSASSSDVGLVRTTNEDLAVESPNLFAVADGMGGHAGGEVAARLAVNCLRAAFRRRPTDVGLTEAVAEANDAVFQESLDNPELRGMGTTLTALAVVDDDQSTLALVNVGDSRAYRYRHGQLEQLTADHSLAEEMVRTGELTASEAAVHPHRHILTRALGVTDEVATDLWRIRPVTGDRYLLCSDGLTNEIDDHQIAEVLDAVSDRQRAADLLVQAARTHGGSDNITVVVVDVEEGVPETTSAAGDGASTDGAAAPAASDMAADGDHPPEPAGTVTEPPAETNGEPPTDTDTGTDEPAVESSPSLRQRRRDMLRERRTASGRRIVTVRTLIFVALVAAVLVGAFFAVRWYNSNSYFVGVHDNELVIYQGRIGGFLWFHPEQVERTGVKTGEVPGTYLGALHAGVEETSVRSARNYVSNLVTVKRDQSGSAGTTTTTSAPPPTTTSPPATAAAGM